MKIATWNVNSIKARIPIFEKFAREHQPDVMLLQEIKCESDKFPFEIAEDLGYNIELLGQKSYNGVAILSKYPITDVSYGVLEGDEQARYIEAIIEGEKTVRVASVYVPNGNSIDSDKFEHKMQFFTALKEHLNNLRKYDEPIIIGGDFNVSPFDIDVYNVDKLRGEICFHPKEQTHMREILNNGWHDSYRKLHPTDKQFTWWDYRAGGYKANKGLRIDFLLANSIAMDKIVSCETIETIRAEEKTSDHAPVMLEI